jgi:hypothetical protein
MFYNTGDPSGNGNKGYGTIDGEGITNSTLTASNTNTTGSIESGGGLIAGILFFDDRQASTYINNPTSIITGGSGANLTGALYFPSSSLTYAGGTAQSTYSIVVAWQLNITGNSVFNDNYANLPGGGSPIHVAYLAE